MFKVNDLVVYPTHGLGKIVEIRSEIIMNNTIELFVVQLRQDNATISVPFNQVQNGQLRSIASKEKAEEALNVLLLKPEVNDSTWNKRIIEYRSKVNSGDLCVIAEVLRDLHVNSKMNQASYSEKAVYDDAFSRIAGELAIIMNKDEENIKEKVLEILNTPNKNLSKKRYQLKIKEMINEAEEIAG